MARREHFISGWDFPISPETVVNRTKAGGYTVNPNTGQEPTSGTMVSIPGHEVPVPMDKFSEKDVADFVTPERKEVFKQPEMHLGTWRSKDDPAIGDAAYLDISKRYEDTPTGSASARKAAMEGSQWALYNIDRDKFEKNITKPEVVEGIREENKIDIPQEEIKEYESSELPVGEHVALGYLTEPDVIKTKSGRKKTVAGAGQMTFLELGSKAN
jgi:hypothetical protein